MPRVTILLPVSRHAHLDAIFARLELMECEAEQTSLFTYIDGDAELYVKARNLTEQSKFKQRLCIHRQDKTPIAKFDVRARRKRIAAIHQEVKQHIQACDYILLLEDDGIPPTNTLQKLLDLYALHPYAGFVTGVEVGRWGVPALGLWAADDVYEPTSIKSLPVGKGIQEIDAAGLYACLTRKEHYLRHEFKPFEDILGPDFAWGLELRREGLKNYVDHSLVIPHMGSHGKALTPKSVDIARVEFRKDKGRWYSRVFK